MLTLKIIHTDLQGGRTTHLFSGERLSHTETEHTDHSIEFTSDDQYFFLIGELTKTNSIQPFIVSLVEIFDGNDRYSVTILPHSECFVMSNGKTVDSFSAYYK